jgi:hypothetical protein
MAKKKKKVSKRPNLFREAAKNKSFKSAKKAEAKAAARKRAAWKKAVAAAKRKIKSKTRKRK